MISETEKIKIRQLKTSLNKLASHSFVKRETLDPDEIDAPPCKGCIQYERCIDEELACGEYLGHVEKDILREKSPGKTRGSKDLMVIVKTGRKPCKAIYKLVFNNIDDINLHFTEVNSILSRMRKDALIELGLR